MNIIVFYLGALVFYGLGAHFIKNTHPYSRSGGDIYVKREKLRLMGKVLLVIGTISLGTAILTQLYSGNN